LPPGIPRLALEQVRKLFGEFQSSDRRPRLFRRLTDFVTEVRKTGRHVQVLIDGSFVMACVDQPEDIDIILVMPPEWDFAAELRPFQYNLLSRKRVKKRFGFDSFAGARGSAQEADLIKYFQGLNAKWVEKFNLPADLNKGIIEVVS